MAEADRPSPRPDKGAARSLAHQGGNVALIFALLLPVVLVTGLGGIELNQVLADKKRTQDVADSAALFGAGQLSVTPLGADQRAQAFAQTQLADVERNATVTVSATIADNGAMTLAVDTQRDSFFGNLLPAGGFHTHVTSIAKGVNTVPLCVLGIASTGAAIHLTAASQLQAGQCMIHSNGAITVDPAATILASASEAGTTAAGTIVPAADLQAPSIVDPFANVNVAPPSSCSGIANVAFAGNTAQTLQPGVHGGLSISGNATVTLASGDHYFCGNVTLKGNGTLTGTDVDMVFDGSATLSFSGAAPVVGGIVSKGSGLGPSLSLGGRQSGPLAGFVLIVDRSVTNTFTLQSDYITNLNGTVYAPSATLAVTGSAISGSSTPWTVVTAHNLTVNGGARLVVNADYAASSVPVPFGVGNRRSNVELTQ